MVKKITGLLLVPLFIVFLLPKINSLADSNTGLQTPTGIVSGKITYTDTEFPDEATPVQMNTLNNIVNVTYQSNPELYTQDVMNPKVYNLNPIKINLTGNIYHDYCTIPAYAGPDTVRDTYMKILSMKLGDPNKYEVIKTYTLLTCGQGGSAYTRRNMTESVYNQDYYNYISNELNPSPTPEPTPVPTKTYTSTRIWGQQRMDTAEEIAKNFNSNKVSNVLLAYAFNYPDALSASTLAAQLNAPILLSGGTISSSVQALDYINNHLAKGGTVYILGGSGVINTSMDTYLQGKGFTTKRLGGSTRYDTNASVVDQETAAQGTPVILAYQGNFPDALSASGIASIKDYPILYSDLNSLPQQTINELKKIKPSIIYITGDTGVISDNVRTTLKNILGISDINIIRMGGATRFDTCLDIAKQFNLNTSNAVIAWGYNFPDALSGSILCQKYNAPLIIIDNSDVSKQKTYINSTNITNLYVLGGNGVVSDDALNLLKK